MTGFTEEQKSAIENRRMDACVVAGPGSGKTTVLVERYRSLVEKHGFSPDQIVAITFTEKAAANMKARLVREFRGDEQRLRELDRAWVSTIHGFCARVLRENAIAAGVDPRFVVLDAREAEELAYECLNAALDEFMAARTSEMLALIEALQKPYLMPDLLGAWDAIRSSGKSIADVRAMRAPFAPKTGAELGAELRALAEAWPSKLTPTQASQRSVLFEFAGRLGEADGLTLAEWLPIADTADINLNRVPTSEREALRRFRDRLITLVDGKTAALRDLMFDTLARFEALYCTRKAQRGALDFDDLEKCTIVMLEADRAVRTRLQSQFRQVMLDEFQDINDQQDRLIGLIRAKDAFFGVGDINQSIYGFRHARPEIFRSYHKVIEEQGKHSAQLLENFRSHDGILRCVETLLHGEPGIEPRQLIAREPAVDLAPAIEVLRVIDGDEDESGEKEARWIACRVLRLREECGYQFRDFAVLCRSGDSMKPILRAFDEASIPYICGRRDSVLSSREGRDLTALLYTISNPRDTVALATVLRSPLAGLSDEALLRLRTMAGTITAGLNMLGYDCGCLADFAEDDAEKLRRFIVNLRRWRLEAATAPVDLLVTRVLADCNLRWAPGTASGENVESFLRIARARGANRPLVDFLRELESLENAVDTEAELADEDQGDQVQVMTAHAAKGLEFPVTIIAAMHKGVQRDSASISFTPEHGLGIRWRSPADRDGVKDSWQFTNGERLKQRDKEEGNRLLYVAMTRAEKRLILSWSSRNGKAQNWAGIVESAFGLKDRTPMEEATIEMKTAVNGAEWTASVLVTAAEPPRVNARASAPANLEPVELVAAPAAADRSDSSIAVTSLAVFNECPRKYYLARYAGWSARARRELDFEGDLDESGDIGELSASELGTELHDALAEKAGEYSDEALRLANVFRKGPLALQATRARRVAREWEFIADIDGMFVRGSIDLWFEDADGEITIVDYKTDEVSEAEAPARARVYKSQLALYALALGKALGKPPMRAYLHFLKPDHIEDVELSASGIDAARELVSAARSAQNELRFDLKEGAHCRSCAYFRELCPAIVDRNAA